MSMNPFNLLAPIWLLTCAYINTQVGSNPASFIHPPPRSKNWCCSPKEKRYNNKWEQEAAGKQRQSQCESSFNWHIIPKLC